MSWSRLTLSANPTGGVVTAGTIAISTHGPTLTIQQQSQRAIINWQDFSIAAGEFTKFIQPDAASAVLNRVVSGNPSTLLGNLAANGRIFLLNPNGILVGAGARIDAAGFLASTLDVRDDDFLRGGDLLFRGDSTAAVQNLGAINALGGDIFLIARRVENKGNLAAANGTAGLAAGSEVLFTTGGNERVFVQAASAPGVLLNAGQISAATAELKAAGGNAYALAINNSGVVRATGTAVRDGQVWLVANGGTVVSSGTLAATSGDRGGEVRVLGEQVSLTGGASIDVSGASGGGTILAGGDYQGKNPAIPNAQATTVDAGVTLKADATVLGNGGKIIVWSDEHTVFGGSISARGGASGGDGGLVEVSGHRLLDFAGTVDLRAPHGNWGTLLLDPENVTISSGATGNGTLGGGSFTPNGDNSILNTTDLQNALASGNVAVTTGATGSQTGDITVANAVTWSSGSILTLSAYHDIAVNAALTSTNSGAFVLRADNTGKGVGKLNFGAGGSISATGGSVKLYFNSVDNGAGSLVNGTSYTGVQSYSGSVSLNGGATLTQYALVNTVYDLQNVRNNLSGIYAQGHDIDASGTSGWNSGAGFVPIGGIAGTFKGTFDGNSYTIAGLYINLPSTSSYVGLFGLTDNNPTFSTLNNVRLDSVNITGGDYTGGLVGGNYGNISNSSVSGSVSGQSRVGGIVGHDSGGGAITNSQSSASIAGLSCVGGLAGYKYLGSISGSSSTSTVAMSSGGTNSVGGLVGYLANCPVSNSYHITGSVTGTQFTGGLMGYNSSSPISNCYNTGAVNGGANSDVGGLIGQNSGAGSSVTASFNTGAVSGKSNTGGLIGEHASAASITYCYNTGPVNAGTGTQVGGLVGRNYNGGSTVGAITYCYNTGSVVAGVSNVGGLVGFNSGSTVTFSFWDTQTSGKATSSGGGVGMTTAQMKSQANFTSATAANGNVNPNWNFASVWRMYDGYTYPLLKTFLTPLTVTANGATRTYDGTSYSGGNGVTYSTTPTAALLGTLSYGGTSQGARNAGTFTIAPTGLYSGQFGYDLTAVSGSLTINKAALTLTAASATKAYDGTTASVAVPTAASLGSGDTLTGLAEIYNSPNAGSRTLSVSGYTVNDGNSGNNYTVTLQTASGTINPATLSYSANAASRTYGATNPAFGGTVTGLVNGETLASVTTGTAAFSSLATTSSNAGSYAINGAGLTASNGNYTLVQAAGNATALTINPATLTYTATPASRTYGATNPAFSGTITGLVNGETQAGATTGALTFTSPAIATSGVGSYAINGSGLTANNGNYTFGQAVGNVTALTINPATLTITASDRTKTYGSTLTLGTSAFTTGGLQNGETVGSVTLTAGGGTAATDAATTYALTPSAATGGTFSAGNYSITYTPGTLTVNPLAVTLSGSRTYDGTTGAAAGILTITNKVGSDAITLTGSGTLAGKSVGAETLTLAGLALGGGAATNYTLTGGSGAVTINPLAIAVSGVTATDKVYDRSTTASLNIGSAGLSGVIGGDTVNLSTAGAAGSFADWNVGIAKPVTVSGFTISGADAGNYSLTQPTGVTAGISAKPISVTGVTAIDKVYDRSTTAGLNTGSAGLSGVIGGDTVNLSAASAAGVFGDWNVGVAKGVTAAGFAIAGASAGNYFVTQPTGLTATISPATLTYTAAAASRTYGAANPTFGGTVTGFVAGDTQAGATSGALTFTSSAIGTSGVGSYAINGSGLTANNGNYIFGQAVGNATALTINPATLTITASDRTKTYGSTLTLGTSAFTTGGLQNGETVGSVTLTSAGVAATAGVAGSPYAITPSAATGGSFSTTNYTIGYVPGALTINPAALTITADSKSKAFGAANPALTASYTGLVNGDTAAVISGLTLNTTATTASAVGSYPITAADATAGNYTITFTPGTLAVGQNLLTISADNKTKTYGAALPGFTASFSGLLNGDTSSVVTGLQFSTTATVGSNVGSYAITPFGAAATNYALAYVPGTLTINSAALTITANSATKIYGAALPSFTASYAGLVNGDTSSVVTGLQFNTAATTASNVGSYAITPFGASATNYTIGYVPGTLTINPAALTIAADSKSKAFGAANPALTASYTGLVNGDTYAVVSGLTLNTTATLASAVGSYPIAAAGATAGNYTITFTPGTLAVGQNLLTISADNKTKTYGAALPGFTASFSGLVNGDTSSVVTGLQFSTTATVGSNVGTYAITPFGAAATNYALAYVPGTLTINSAALTITANNATKTYGAALPSFTASYVGLVNGDTSSVVTGLQFNTTVATASNVGSYGITPSSASAANYTIGYVPGTLTINPAALTIAADGKSRAFGVANPPLTASYAGLVNGDTSSVVTGLTLSTTATNASAVGSYPITPAGATAGNYTLTFVPGTLAVGQNLLTITADNKTKTYGAALPGFTARFSGLVNGDTSSVVTGLQFSTTATVGSNVGTYAITPFGASATNYALAYVPGTLTINSAALTITANNATKTYGAALPSFTASYAGLVNGDTSSVVTGLQFNTTATTASNVGSFAITPSGALATNYTIGYVPGTLTINPAALTITADSKSKAFGAANPALTASYIGLVNGDTSAVVSGLTLNTTATPASPAGNYAITPGGALAANYTVAFIPGMLHVSQPTITVNNRPAEIVTVDLVPVQTDEFVVAEFGGRCVLIPAMHARLGASLDNVLTDSLHYTGKRAFLTVFDGGPTAPSESPRTARLGWREELQASSRLVARAIVHSSSFDAFSPHENPVRGLLFTATP